MMDVAREKFAFFVRHKAAVLQVSTDSTPMRLSAIPIGNASSLEVYVRTVVSLAADGEEMKFTPELSLPTNSTAAGALSAIPIKDLL